jgi:SAM-dependent methyltransferase
MGQAPASHWDVLGTEFPSVKGAASTAYYRACEERLFRDFFPDLPGRSLLKTDLWDEAKNTEILQWAARQGAQPLGIDVAHATVRTAARLLDGHRPAFVVADVRAIPFRAASCDLVYSMGTIEHVPDPDRAIAEIFRVLRPGGTAIIGVPNALDPFLRPLLVRALSGLDLYPYAPERSFTPRVLRRRLEAAGFRVTATTGLLFIPGWLRMLDLWCHTRCPQLSQIMGCLTRPFEWLEARVPAVRRHGYLVACVAHKPEPALGSAEP